MKFSIVGTGNAAHHFTVMLKTSGHHLHQVYSRDIEHAQNFTQRHGGIIVTELSQFSKENELIIIAVKDDAIQEVSAQLSSNIMVVHTSGMTPISALKQHRSGVVWPLQTLSSLKSVSYREMPLLIEGSDLGTQDLLHKMFTAISVEVHIADSRQRAAAHLAAVFANNFVNQLYDIAGEILSQNGQDIKILLPIIREAADKIAVMSPEQAQTGPARRGDIATINRHLELLKNEELAEIYRLFTNRILRKNNEQEL